MFEFNQTFIFIHYNKNLLFKKETTMITLIITQHYYW